MSVRVSESEVPVESTKLTVAGKETGEVACWSTKRAMLMLELAPAFKSPREKDPSLPTKLSGDWAEIATTTLLMVLEPVFVKVKESELVCPASIVC